MKGAGVGVEVAQVLELPIANRANPVALLVHSIPTGVDVASGLCVLAKLIPALMERFCFETGQRKYGRREIDERDQPVVTAAGLVVGWLLVFYAELPVPTLLAVGGWVAAGLWAWGGLLEGRRWAPWLEGLRWVAAPAIAPLLWPLSWVSAAATAAAALSWAGLWWIRTSGQPQAQAPSSGP